MVASAINTFEATASIEILAWNHPASLARLRSSEIGPQFFALTNHFESEINKFYCAVCSGVIVLNALRAQSSTVTKPSDPTLYPGCREHLPEGLSPVFQRYTQSTFLNANTDKIKCREVVLGRTCQAEVACGEKCHIDELADCGLQLHELARMLEHYGLRCELTHASEKLAKEDFKRSLVSCLRKPDSYVIANYSRVPLEQGRGSHMSPVAAYDVHSNSFLVLDVNPNVAPWAWIHFDLLYEAMNTFDTLANRGFVTVEEGGTT